VKSSGVIATVVLKMCTDFIPISNAAVSPSAAERFSSPAAGSGAKRRLFDSGEGKASSSSSSRSSASDGGSQSMPIPMVLVADKTGRQVLLPTPFGTSLEHVFTSAVRIVFFFISNRIEYWTIICNFESNRIVFAVLKSRDVKFIFFLTANFSC